MQTERLVGQERDASIYPKRLRRKKKEQEDEDEEKQEQKCLTKRIKKMFFDPPTHLNNSGADRSPGDEQDSY